MGMEASGSSHIEGDICGDVFARPILVTDCLQIARWFASLFNNRLFPLDPPFDPIAPGRPSSVGSAGRSIYSYDKAGRLTAMRFPAGAALWRTQSYYDWSVRSNGT